MDLKRVQEELRSDILHHQELMELLKKNPTDQALNFKLKGVQKHIAVLGAKQRRIILSAKVAHSENSQIRLPAASIGSECMTHINYADQSNQTHVKQTKNKDDRPSGSLLFTNSDKYTFITIKDKPQPTLSPAGQGTKGPTNLPINLDKLAVGSSITNKSFTSLPTLLVVSSSNQIPGNPIVTKVLPQKSASTTICLTSLVSTGGVVTLPGWMGTQQSPAINYSAAVQAVGRILPSKQVQIKVPVVQSNESNPVILMKQKSQVSSQGKSLFRLLPKGCHPIPVNSVCGSVVSASLQKVLPSPQINKYTIPKNPIPSLMMANDASNAQALQQILLQRVCNLTTVAPPTSVAWQDLSSRTPSIHKPSYIPRKTFPNINNGVGSFQKFRILDGKAQILPKTSREYVGGCSSSFSQATLNKPRNTALKAALSSSKPNMSSVGTVTLARLIPTPVPKNVFFPIQQRQDSASSSFSVLHSSPNESPFVPVPITTGSASSFRPVSANDRSASYTKGLAGQTPTFGQETEAKILFLRNIDLIPKEQAEKVRSRRFRKRRVAAHPLYSGGMYISNELVEPKRQCPGLMANAIESIIPPDVIVKRPRGRPRGSKNITSTTLRPQSATRGTRTSPSLPANMEEIRKLKGILDAVSSVSKRSTYAGSLGAKDLSLGISYGAKISEVAKMVKEAESSSNTRPKTPGDDVDGHEDQCATCGKTGEVLMCDTCSRVYHLSCATPPLTAVPQGMWICSKCKLEFKDSKAKVEWPGIVAAVHAYIEHDKSRDREIEARGGRLEESRKLGAMLKEQIKLLNSVVMNKAASKSKILKEKQTLFNDIGELSDVMRCVWNHFTPDRSGGSLAK